MKVRLKSFFCVRLLLQSMFLLSTHWAAAATYIIDETHTSVHFSVAHFERSAVRGRLLKVSGAVDFDPVVRTGTVDVRIDPDSLDTGLKVLDGVLLSSQFLHVELYPEIRFQSTAFEFDGEKLKLVRGRLSLHGVTLPVELVANRFTCGEVKLLALRRYVCGGEFHTTIKRSEFGLKGYLPDVADEVRLDIAIEASPAN